MMQSIATATISKPIHLVFPYLRRLENQVHYNTSIQSISKISETPEVYEMEIDLGFFRKKEKYRIEEIQEPHLLIARCDGSSLQFRDEYRLEPDGDSTRVEVRDSMELLGLLKFSEPLAHPILKHQMQENLNRLKAILESEG